jgi:hypothetical protein
MYDKYTYEEILNEVTKTEQRYNEITISSTSLICTTNGEIFRKMKSGIWKKVKNCINHNCGYNVILINKKQYTRAKLILYSQGGIQLQDKNVNIFHINQNRLDCHYDNLTCYLKKQVKLTS